MGERAYEAGDKRNPDLDAISKIDRQLDRMNSNLDELRKKLDPVMSRYESEEIELAEPREEPRSPLAERGVVRLADLNSRIERIIQGIDL